ncbi:MAG: glycosyltransferase family 4 protein [Bryobacteraceae bacterium]
MTDVLYSAAHGGFPEEAVPLGGGAAVCNQLATEWARTNPFRLRLLTPSLLGEHAPGGAELVRYSEREYARFCYRFDHAVTSEILNHDPAQTRVLINDISEAPDFERLHRAGFRMFTIYHVDVVAYVARMYGRGLVSPKTLVKWYDAAWPLFPRIAKLVFEKQKQSLLFSHRVVVPSQEMRDLLLSCYPRIPDDRIRVLPWGHWLEPSAGLAVETEALRRELKLGGGQPVLVTLSRISPEKGQHRLLRSIERWESSADFPRSGLTLLICGEAAYMAGRRYLRHLQSLASRLRRTRVLFPGYVTGVRKQAVLAAADLYVFPSVHESYGLTLVEALAMGVPAVCLDHHGAREVMRPGFGAVVPPSALLDAIRALLADPERRKSCGQAARAWAATQRFSDRAATLAGWLIE